MKTTRIQTFVLAGCLKCARPALAALLLAAAVGQVSGALNVSPSSQINLAGTTATFSVNSGNEALAFQWMKDGVALAEGANYRGTQTNSLTLWQVFGADAGGYSVAVSNSTGWVTSTVARLTVVDPVITSSPQSQSMYAGSDLTLVVLATGTQPLHYQWWKDGGSLSAGTEALLTVLNLTQTDAGSYWVVVSNQFGQATSAVAQVTVFADVTQAFGLAVQPDGKLVLGGSFTTWAGQDRNFLARLNGGNLDAFAPEPDDEVNALAVQDDGKILVLGFFTTLGTNVFERYNLGRLNQDGSVDPDFNPAADYWVESMALQADGKILVGGNFSNLGGQPCAFLGRLNANGSLDTNFNAGADGRVLALAVQGDGKILVAGGFSHLGGQRHDYIGRLNANGTVDSGFTATAEEFGVYALVLQSDGKIVVGGSFTKLCGQTRNFLGRLNTDGTLDIGFAPAVDALVETLALQTDGKILVGGSFKNMCGQGRKYLARLNTNGTLDAAFNPAPNDWVNVLGLQADGTILADGGFSLLGGQSQVELGRLTNTAPATQTLSYDGTAITWMRGGTSPELWRTAFEKSTDGINWVPLGSGSRIAGGWRLTGVSLATGNWVRARGYQTGGYANGSSWFVESLYQVSSAIRQTLVRQGNNVVLSWTGGYAPYQVQQSTNVSTAASWVDVGGATQTNSATLPINPGRTFLRVQGK